MRRSLFSALCAALCVSAFAELKPRGLEDRTEDFLSAAKLPAFCGWRRVAIADGDYHFYSSSATKMRFHITNHDQPKERPVFLPLVGLTNVVFHAHKARFIMHGEGTAILLEKTQNIEFSGITIEWEKPFFAQAEIVGFGEKETFVRFAARDTVELKGSRLQLVGEDWRANLVWGNIFDAKTHEILFDTGDVGVARARAAGEGVYALGEDLSKRGAKVGDIFVMRDYARPHPVVCLNEAENTLFEDFTFRDGFGMGILAQQSRNITCRNVACTPRSANEYCANTVDAIHVANCSGRVIVEDSRFEGMMDDALNVHSTSLAIVEKSDEKTIKCRFMHNQAYGLDLFAAGEHIRFIAGSTLENGPLAEIAAVEVLDERVVKLTLKTPIPAKYGEGDAIENADRQCEVEFRRNRVANNRARGVLFTTPKPVLCEDNVFDHVSGSAILLAGDAVGWYESGACENVVIRRNKFIDCLTSPYQYCNAVISIYPEVKDLAAQKRPYHHNIRIEYNHFETYDVPLLYAVSAENLFWRDNEIRRHARYPGREKPRFVIRGCRNVRGAPEEPLTVIP